jgi:S-formylglutathione hydrolase
MPEHKNALSGGWEERRVSGKRVEVFCPVETVRYVCIYLHSYSCESLATRTALRDELLRYGLVCIRPDSGQSWWTNRRLPGFDPVITPEQFIVEHLVPWIRGEWDLSARSIGLFGFDMGGQGALRLAFRHPAIFPVVAALAPSIDYHELYWSGLAIDDMYRSKEECRQDTATMHINPYDYPQHIFFATDPDDPWWRGSDRLREKLTALGIPHTCDLATRAGGHTWDYFDRMVSRALRYVKDGVERESRRLL